MIYKNEFIDKKRLKSYNTGKLSLIYFLRFYYNQKFEDKFNLEDVIEILSEREFDEKERFYNMAIRIMKPNSIYFKEFLEHYKKHVLL